MGVHPSKRWKQWKRWNRWKRRRKGGNGSSGGKTQTVYTYYVTNVTVNEAGGTPAPVNNVRQFQFLPNDATPVLVYLGTASAGKQALFLVSKDVTSVGGNGTCFPSADACQLLGLNVGAGATCSTARTARPTTCRSRRSSA